MKGGIKFGKNTVAYVNEINRRLQESNKKNNNEFNLTPREQLNLNNESVKKNVESARGILKNSSEYFRTKPNSFLSKLKGNRKSRSKKLRKKSSGLRRRGFNEVPTASKYNQERAYRRARLMEKKAEQNGGKTRKHKRKTRRATKKRGRKSRKN